MFCVSIPPVSPEPGLGAVLLRRSIADPVPVRPPELIRFQVFPEGGVSLLTPPDGPVELALEGCTCVLPIACFP